MAKAKDAKTTEPAPAEAQQSGGLEAGLQALQAMQQARADIPEFEVRTDYVGDGPTKFPKKLARITFDDLGYTGWWCDGWLNPPLTIAKQWDESMAEGEDETRRMALVIFPGWNFVTQEGGPVARTVEGFDDVPQEVFYRMLRGRIVTISRAAQNPFEATSSPPPNREQKRAAARRNGATGRR